MAKYVIQCVRDIKADNHRINDANFRKGDFYTDDGRTTVLERATVFEAKGQFPFQSKADSGQPYSFFFKKVPVKMVVVKKK